jgi:hypothetical protein
MTVIRQEDFIASVAGALQYISYYHPVDYIRSLAKAYEKEESAAAKDAMAQILINSRMCAEGHRPICQDTGIVSAFVKVGMEVRFEPGPGEERKDLQEMVDEGVRRAYLDPDNKLRASQHQRQYAGGGECGVGKGRDGRVDSGGQGRRVGGEVEVCDAESLGFDCGVGAEDGADDGCGMVSAGDAGNRDWRDSGKSDVAGQTVTDGADRYAGTDCTGAKKPRRGTAH